MFDGNGGSLLYQATGITSSPFLDNAPFYLRPVIGWHLLEGHEHRRLRYHDHHSSDVPRPDMSYADPILVSTDRASRVQQESDDGLHRPGISRGVSVYAQRLSSPIVRLKSLDVYRRSAGRSRRRF
jgi:hypothetical protein